MQKRHQGSSFIEVLVALALIMVGGISMATIQRETAFQQQQLLWRWQGKQWLEVLSTTEASLAQTLPTTPERWCEQAQPMVDCSQQYCQPQDMSQWQRRQLCQTLQQDMPGAVVVLKPCGSHHCLSLANTAETAQTCELEQQHCLMRLVHRS